MRPHAGVEISIHAPRTGSDPFPALKQTACLVISIHAPRTGSDLPLRKALTGKHISIHAPRTGSDYLAEKRLTSRLDFNPRSPHGERPGGRYKIKAPDRFQSTLPARGATEIDDIIKRGEEISIHAPRTGSDFPITNAFPATSDISIHAPRTGSDTSEVFQRFQPQKFQSTLPARGATR